MQSHGFATNFIFMSMKKFERMYLGGEMYESMSYAPF